MVAYTHIYVFYGAQIAVSAYALWQGGAPERWVASLMVAAAAISSATSQIPGVFEAVNRVELLVDLGFMAALTLIAARASRFWPMYVAALHLVGVAVHGVRAIDPDILPLVYARAPAAVAYPMLLLLAIGTTRHARRLRRSGSRERDWSTFRW